GVVTKVGAAVDGVGEKVTMLGNTLEVATTAGPVGQVTNTLGDQVLVPVVSMLEATTQNLGDRTKLGDPLNTVLHQDDGSLGGLGDKVAGAGDGNVLTTTLGTALGNSGGVAATSGGLLVDGNKPGLLETVGGVVAGVGTGLDGGSSDGLLSSVGVDTSKVGGTVASLGGLVGGTGTPATSSASMVVTVAGVKVGAALTPVVS